ncbi:MAG: HAMP domain-containing histidine kinase [Clostridia bacterium]|nr:HAMP domain-containing histidine kinase [Clostridia bacterium]
MKKLKLPKWKTKRKVGFRGYFTIFVMIIICIAVVCSILLEDLATSWIFKNIDLPEFIIVLIASLIIGVIIAWFVSRFALDPIKKIRNAMIEVADGNFNASVKEESRFDEIEDINHAFNIMIKELRSTEVIQSDFVSNVSHEFKTPLTAIEGYTMMLQMDDLTEEEKKEYTEKILFNTRRMSELVQNILLLSKLDNQGIESKKEEFSIDEQIRQVVLTTESEWLAKNIDFDIHLQSVKYLGNEVIISHIWSNLIENAIKFSPDNGKITLELTGDEDMVCFSVSDEGNGIEESQKQNIFNKFYQADSSHKQTGNGLGLAIVKSIVTIYNGEVFVENLQEKGCKFTVKLPK